MIEAYHLRVCRALRRTKLLPATRFGGHMDVNCYANLQSLNVRDMT